MQQGRAQGIGDVATSSSLHPTIPRRCAWRHHDPFHCRGTGAWNRMFKRLKATGKHDLRPNPQPSEFNLPVGSWRIKRRSHVWTRQLCLVQGPYYHKTRVWGIFYYIGDSTLFCSFQVFLDFPGLKPYEPYILLHQS